jgi:hypothetical protein
MPANANRSKIEVPLLWQQPSICDTFSPEQPVAPRAAPKTFLDADFWIAFPKLEYAVKLVSKCLYINPSISSQKKHESLKTYPFILSIYIALRRVSIIKSRKGVAFAMDPVCPEAARAFCATLSA